MMYYIILYMIKRGELVDLLREAAKKVYSFSAFLNLKKKKSEKKVDH